MRFAPDSDAVFLAVAHPLRRLILELLVEEMLPVGALLEALNSRTNDGPQDQESQRRELSLPALSQHLKVLREAGLVSTMRDGRKVYYRPQPEPLAETLEWMQGFVQAWKDRLDALGSYLEGRSEQK